MEAITVSNLQLNTVAVFGLFLLFGVAGGIMASRIRWMPTITAFMLLGFAIGPHGLRLITAEVLSDAAILTDIALGLILYKLGNMLHPKAMLRSRRLLLTSLAEAMLSFLGVFLLMYSFGNSAALSALVGAIAVSSSPAVLVHVSDELRAAGPVTERAKSLVAMNNLFSFVVFSIALPFALATEEKGIGSVFILPLYRLSGAILIGAAVGWLATRITKLLRPQDEHYRFAIIIGSVMLTLGMSGIFKTSALLSPLVLGMATRWFETSRHNLSRVGLGEGGDLFYIVLFVMAGAKLNPALLVTTGIIPFLLAIVRSAGKFSGVFALSRYAKFTMPQATATSLLLVPMAGMAIGLVTTTANLVPEMGGQVAVIVFTMVAIFETIGPFAAAHAFRISDEIGKANEKGAVAEEEERV